MSSRGAPRSCCTFAPARTSCSTVTRLRSIVRKYSDHVSIPILMPGEGKGDDADRDEDEGNDEETINAATALWTRNKSELGDDDYKGF